jgi:outer membrane protein OmpA-like peptidoglycan-associated protein
MKKLTFILLGLFAQAIVFAQQPQWACKLTSTNDPNKDDYAPSEALYIPDAYPSGKQCNGYTYVMGYTYEKVSAKTPVIKFKLEYCTPIIAEQVVIVETGGPGAITKVEIEDINGKVKQIYKGKALAVKDATRLFAITFTRTLTPIRYVSIEAMPGDVTGYNCIDAVALCSTKDPLDIKINIGGDINFVQPAKPLGPGVNSSYTEVLPVISPDGRTLYFDRKDHPNNIANPDKPGTIYDDIYKSRKGDDGQWKEAVNVGKPLNNGSHNFVNSISPDGNTMLLANTYNADGSPKGAGASITRRIKGQGWSIPEELKIEGFNNNNAYVSFFMSNNNSVLLMSIEDNDSYGEKDIYVSFPKEDGGWTKPANVGADLNTMVGEYSPTLASDNTTLYFASKGHYGYGGYDIYMTKRLDDTWKRWSKPVNLGPKVNTVDSDMAFSIPASGKEVYIYSWNGDATKSDIFHLDLGESKSIKPNPVYLISGKVYNAKTKKPIHADILYEILPGGKQAGTAGSDPDDGSYKIVLPAGKHYGYFAQAKGYMAIHENLDIPEITEYTEIQKDLYLVPIEVGQQVNMKNVFFEQGKPVMLSTSYPELDRLVRILTNNPTIEIRVDGHTDNQGDAKKNMELSQQRVDVVKDYLVNKGINAKRITTKAFGGTKPIASNATEETRKLNRRVEFTITKQ